MVECHQSTVHERKELCVCVCVCVRGGGGGLTETVTYICVTCVLINTVIC